MNVRSQSKAAKTFAEKWADKGNEKQDSQRFWIELLQTVYGVENPADFVRFEQKVKLEHTSFIDVMIPATHTMIEQKSRNKDLNAPIKQSDGSFLKPSEQAKRYAAAMPYSERPRWIVSCNFREFQVFDMERPNDEPEHINLKNLGEEYYRLQFMVDVRESHITREMELSHDAGQLVGKIYDSLLPVYGEQPSEKDLQDLNKFIVRLVFCFYAEDAGLFGKRNMFHDYLAGFDSKHFRGALKELFALLDTREDERDRFLEAELAAFPYVNGSLFTEVVPIPPISEATRELILGEGCDFDWSKISPTIFGAIFESTLNPVTRRSGGMHYTSIEHIHKVIDPLFLDGYREKFQAAMEEKTVKKRLAKLEALQEELAAARFLDPAAGSGNFLTESYLSLRRLENDILRETVTDKAGTGVLGFVEEEFNPIKVSIDQFYGIEINDFAVAVARTAMWIAESQMFAETVDIIHREMDFLPLHSNANIHEGNALRVDWEELVSKDKLSYIMGNPPFVGARMMGKEQKTDVENIFAGWKNLGNLDYVSCWYKKSADYMKGASVRTALVSTNSICQGDSVAILWKPLLEDGIHIDFAHRTFRWDSESSLKAHVHCVIVGFSRDKGQVQKKIYTDGQMALAENINAYLLDADNVLVESRNKPICDVPTIGIGNKPIDGGNYLFTEEEMKEFIKKEPVAKQYFKPWYGSQEFINRKPRYCLWLGECSPGELRKMPQAMKRVEAVRELRLASKSQGTQKLADTPTRFHVENMPRGTYIVIPEVSSQRRRYVPMGYMDDSVLCSNKVRLMPEATLFHFGILNSNVHMSWMRVVCGRLKSDYDYSIKIVYNNFPWPTPTDAQRAAIEKTAQGILDARALYPDSSLADLYDELTMPKELRAAHRANDKAVMQAYGFWGRLNSESECVGELMKLYQDMVK